jgi:hypothetical protein
VIAPRPGSDSPVSVPGQPVWGEKGHGLAVATARKYRFLIDVWAEPREIESLPAVIRARVRDMATDEEHYVGSFAELERIVEARLDAEGIVARRWERP